MTPLIALIDSGVSGNATSHLAAAIRFEAKESGVSRKPAIEDRLRHGSVMADIIIRLAPACRLLNAQIFGERRTTSSGALAEAMDWSVESGARVINLSVGLAADRLILRQACRAALEAGVILLAASPARGGPVFPAAYDGVIRVSGDARCAAGEISALQNAQADFGAHPREHGMIEGVSGGASFSVAWVTGLVARYLTEAPNAGRQEVMTHLLSLSRYHGAERRAF